MYCADFDVDPYVERFFFPTPDSGTEAYNYSGNDRLVEAIRRGHRGAYWDILRLTRGPT